WLSHARAGEGDWSGGVVAGTGVPTDAVQTPFRRDDGVVTGGWTPRSQESHGKAPNLPAAPLRFTGAGARTRRRSPKALWKPLVRRVRVFVPVEIRGDSRGHQSAGLGREHSRACQQSGG